MSGSGTLSLSVSGPGSVCAGAGPLCVSPGPLCVGPPFPVSGPSALCVGPQRSLCQGQALCVGPFCGAFVLNCVGLGARRSLCRAPPLSHCLSWVPGPQLRSVPPLSPIRSAPPTQIRMSPIWSATPIRFACHPSGPRAHPLKPIPPAPRSACHPSGPADPSSDPRATHPAHSFCPRENPKPYCLAE